MSLTPEARRAVAFERLRTTYGQIRKAKEANHGRWKGTKLRSRLAERIWHWRHSFWEAWEMLPESRYCNNPFSFAKTLLQEPAEVKYLPGQQELFQEVAEWRATLRHGEALLDLISLPQERSTHAQRPRPSRPRPGGE